ncbi:colicin V production protein [Lactococcus hodotermopsidis]|uniref:Colicin V production protein n=1 Tax=Pseudolactococcus hodotermopsidis TaxID=2709157 RepID=A0A6A0BED0_9LACT|nr:CvpA family protein [Lactococcus hodotermopsidis]GFH42688.1 colicin V production protein [Lactococcus hodotermopsidis]
MIITILILAMLVWSFLVGYSRGLALQAFYTFGASIALMTASQNYQALGKKLSLWVPFASATQDSKLLFYPNKLLFELDHIFYATLAFLTIYVAIYAIVRFIGVFLTTLEDLTILGHIGNIAGGGLTALCAYVSLSLVFMTLSTIPLAMVQDHLYASGLVRMMIAHTPILSGWLQEMFVTKFVNIK